MSSGQSGSWPIRDLRLGSHVTGRREGKPELDYRTGLDNWTTKLDNEREKPDWTRQWEVKIGPDNWTGLQSWTKREGETALNNDRENLDWTTGLDNGRNEELRKYCFAII